MRNGSAHAGKKKKKAAADKEQPAKRRGAKANGNESRPAKDGHALRESELTVCWELEATCPSSPICGRCVPDGTAETQAAMLQRKLGPGGSERLQRATINTRRQQIFGKLDERGWHSAQIVLRARRSANGQQ